MRRRHRAHVLTIEHERDVALVRSSIDVEDALGRLTDLSGTGARLVEECRTFFVARKNEAVHRLEAVASRFPHFMGHIREETIQEVGLNAERDAIEEIEANGGISPRMAEKLKSRIEDEIDDITKLTWSEVEQLDPQGKKDEDIV